MPGPTKENALENFIFQKNYTYKKLKIGTIPR
jgi:hypothetical protein